MSAPAYPDDPGGLRLALNWFHTWFGLFVGGLLFVMFWTGTLAVFDREIDRWMMPATRAISPPPISADAVRGVVDREFPGARQWRMMLPDTRTPVIEVQAMLADGKPTRRFVDPVTMRLLPMEDTLAGTRFFYPYHFRLNTGAVGLFLCAFAAIVMLALCISGVIIHRKLFADFFTLRIARKPQRTTLDFHNLSGVLALPFLLMISFTGVAIFTYTYLPSARAIVIAGDPAALSAGYFSREAVGLPGGPIASLDMMRDRAAAHWGDRPKYVQIIHPGDANAYVEIRPSTSRTLAKSTEAMWFDAATGRKLGASPVTGTRRFYDVVYGIHLIQFDHWTLRWLYFLSGLAGCLLVATGLLFWVQSRRKRHAKLGLRGVRLAEAMGIAVTTGLLIASLGFLLSNRLIPITTAGRSAMEVWVFHLAWILSAIHAFVRGRVAWREQSWVIAAGCLLAVLLNAITTEQPLPYAITRGLWQTAGVDLVLIAGAVIAMASARKLRRAGPQA